jgi:hypothetical protein
MFFLLSVGVALRLAFSASLAFAWRRGCREQLFANRLYSMHGRCHPIQYVACAWGTATYEICDPRLNPKRYPK